MAVNFCGNPDAFIRERIYVNHYHSPNATFVYDMILYITVVGGCASGSGLGIGFCRL